MIVIVHNLRPPVAIPWHVSDIKLSEERRVKKFDSLNLRLETVTNPGYLHDNLGLDYRLVIQIAYCTRSFNTYSATK